MYLYITSTHKIACYICICLMCFLHPTMAHFPKKKKIGLMCQLGSSWGRTQTAEKSTDYLHHRSNTSPFCRTPHINFNSLFSPSMWYLFQYQTQKAVLNMNVTHWTERVTGRACLWVFLRASPERTNSRWKTHSDGLGSSHEAGPHHADGEGRTCRHQHKSPVLWRWGACEPNNSS